MSALENPDNRWDIFKNSKGQWQWSCSDPGGRFLAASTDTFETEELCIANAKEQGYSSN
ncbi:hypothetical protein [Piscirickettsia litoralis]|uniref:hypothetical protein n=1 Tax=Piscirickettsia litoralis TaxID=1891921 RepID=UPI0013015A1C|nr:hypothetical protein [Piscirickettsia litoralis]